MAESRLFRLRLCYGKTSRLAFLSHLEIIRALERGIRRAALPVAVTEGFSPHMRIAFGSALPVGVASIDELADVYLREYVNPSRALEALSHALAPDLAVRDAAYVEPRAAALTVSHPISVYEALFTRPLEEISIPETLTVVRKKKEKRLVVTDYLIENPMILPLEDCLGDQYCESFSDATMALRFALESKPSGSLRVDGFLKALVGLPNEASLWNPESPVLALARIEQRTAEAC